MNKKGLQNRVFLVFIIALSIVIIGYIIFNNYFSSNEIPTSWSTIDAGQFTLSLPSNWQYNQGQGIDSFIGEFVGNGIKLSFDFGWYSPPLAEDGDSNYIITYEVIDGRQARIIVPNNTEGFTGVNFPDVYSDEGDVQKTGLSVYGNNLTPEQKEIAFRIFRSIRFT